MRKVAVTYHISGDSVTIYDKPWWACVLEWMLERVCPCCGWRGKLIRSEKYYMWWGSLLGKVSLETQTDVLTIPIEDGCAASAALFGKDDFCWRDDCEFHGAPEGLAA